MRYLILVLTLLTLSACGQQPTTAPKPAASHTSSAASQAKSKKASVRPARRADLIGHTFVDQSDANRVLIFTASTSGYYMDVQTRRDGEDFASSGAGIFNAKLSVSAQSYTLTGTAQPNAATNSLRFEKLTNTSFKQLPAGPTYKCVTNDDLRTLN